MATRAHASDVIVVPDTTERRLETRIRLEVSITLESEHNFYTGLSSDISEGGLFVATTLIIPIGSRVGVRFTIPEVSQPVETLVEVRWLRDQSFTDLPAGLGLRFLELATEDREAIKRFMTQRDALLYEE